MEPVPVSALTENVWPISRIAPPPLGNAMLGSAAPFFSSAADPVPGGTASSAT
jgi:hypothetical protein